MLNFPERIQRVHDKNEFFRSLCLAAAFSMAPVATADIVSPSLLNPGGQLAHPNGDSSGDGILRFVTA
jgi:hypothetical protein